jgi:hypothetical protein
MPIGRGGRVRRSVIRARRSVRDRLTIRDYSWRADVARLRRRCVPKRVVRRGERTVRPSVVAAGAPALSGALVAVTTLSAVNGPSMAVSPPVLVDPVGHAPTLRPVLEAVRRCAVRGGFEPSLARHSGAWFCSWVLGAEPGTVRRIERYSRAWASLRPVRGRCLCDRSAFNAAPHSAVKISGCRCRSRCRPGPARRTAPTRTRAGRWTSSRRSRQQACSCLGAARGGIGHQRRCVCWRW